MCFYRNVMSEHQEKMWLLLIVIGLYIILRFWNIAESDLWYDEVFSVLAVRQNWQEMFSAVIRDGVHPPLFYILLKLWSVLNSSTQWLQLFPFLVSVLTLFPFFLLCRVFNLTNLEMSVALLLVAVNSYFLEYSLDLRMYGLVQFFTLFSLWLFVKFQKEKEANNSTFWLLTFVNLMLVYTHYFGWLIVGLEGAYLLYRQQKLFFRFAASSTFVLLCFLPWVFLVLQNAANKNSTGNLDWLIRPSFSSLGWFYTVLNGNANIPHTTFINLLIFGLPLAFMIWRMTVRRQTDTEREILLFFAFAPVIIIFLLSHLLPKSVWESRYLIIAAVPYVILLVKSVFALPTKLSKSIFVGIIIIWSLGAGIYNFSQSPKKIRWSEAAQKIESTGKPVYVFENWVALPLRYYSNEAGFSKQIEKRSSLNEIKDKTFQAAFRYSTPEEKRNQREALTKKNCNITNENIFSDNFQNVVVYEVENCN